MLFAPGPALPHKLARATPDRRARTPLGPVGVWGRVRVGGEGVQWWSGGDKHHRKWPSKTLPYQCRHPDPHPADRRDALRLSPRHSSLLPCTQQSPHSTTRHHLSLRPVWFEKSVSSRSNDEGSAWQEGRRGEVGWSRLGSRGDIRAEHSQRAPSPSRATAKTVRNGDGDPSQAGPQKGCPWDPLPIAAQTRSWEVNESKVSYLSHHTAASGRIFLLYFRLWPRGHICGSGATVLVIVL